MKQLNGASSLFLFVSVTSIFAAGLGATGCNAILGLEPGEKADTSRTPDGGGGGTGGTGGNSAVGCEPGLVEACYSGPEGTQDVGVCKAGTKTCNADGSAFGECSGEVLPAAGACGSTADENCNGFSRSDWIWAGRYGDGGYQFTEGVAIDSAGNVIVVGSFAGSVDFGGGALDSEGANDVFVAKLGPKGEHLWSKRFGNWNEQVGVGVAVDPDGNVVITGMFDGSIDFGGDTLTSAGNRDIFIAKLNRDGGHIWSKRFGDGSNQAGQSVAVDKQGNVALCGSMEGSVNFGSGELTSGGGTDIFVATFDASGKRRWDKRFGDSTAQECKSIAMDADGNVAITGTFMGWVNFGKAQLMSAGSLDVFLAKFGSDGAVLWNHAFGSASEQGGQSVAMSPDGGVVVGGYFSGSINLGGGAHIDPGNSNIFIAKFDSSGTHVWSRGYGDAETQFLESIAVDGCGDVLATGYFSGAVDFGGEAVKSNGLDDLFVLKLGPKGEHVWSKTFGDEAGQYGTAIAVGPDGHAFVAGQFEGTIDMGGGLTTKGAYDALISRFEP
jgi:hypothetical protein